MILRRGRRTPSSHIRRALIVLPLWLVSSAFLWSWWLSSTRDATAYLYIPLTFALVYEYLVLPSAFLYFVTKAKKPPVRRRAQKDLKVAVITLCVPSQESISIVERQLKAMSKITYPHDSWILDEGNDKNIKILAKLYGVKYFSRKGVAKYNQESAPFKAKTKAGNVNAWLDKVKNMNYEYFVQLDIDHNPKSTYLNKTLGYFKDKNVAWVQAPSVYSNLHHWTARGSAEQELVLQGPLQMGFYGHSETPFIIGSHCTYRMCAVREIGGFQPTRAEDHLDTVMLANLGYRGVFIPEVIAQGDGPETLQTYLAQQYAWAYSMFQVLLFHTPKLLKKMPLKRKLQFLFAQTWYPIWSTAYAIMFFVPIASLITNKNVINTSGKDFAMHFLPVFLSGFIIWWAGRPLMQPQNVRLSWRGAVLHAIRWYAVMKAILSALFKIQKPYMITPKGESSQAKVSMRVYRPFLILASISFAAIVYDLLAHKYSLNRSQIAYTSINIFFMLAVCSVQRIQRTSKSFKRFLFTPVRVQPSLRRLAASFPLL
jgi:cellulose synthase (UDP-forming)